MQILLDKAYAYGCEYDILFNSQKYQLMIFDTMKLEYDGNIILGEAPLTVTNSYKHLGHIITDNLSDEADLEDTERVCTGDVMFYSERSIFAQMK